MAKKKSSKTTSSTPMSKYVMLALLIILPIAGFYFGRLYERAVFDSDTKHVTNLEKGLNKKVAAEGVLLGKFEGTLPCADCEGLQTELALYQNPDTLGATDYVLTETYLGRNVSPVITTGKWDYLRGTPNDINATVYQLDPGSENSMNYLKVNDNTIEQLGADMKPITGTNLNFKLTRVE